MNDIIIEQGNEIEGMVKGMGWPIYQGAINEKIKNHIDDLVFNGKKKTDAEIRYILGQLSGLNDAVTLPEIFIGAMKEEINKLEEEKKNV